MTNVLLSTITVLVLLVAACVMPDWSGAQVEAETTYPLHVDVTTVLRKNLIRRQIPAESDGDSAPIAPMKTLRPAATKKKF